MTNNFTPAKYQARLKIDKMIKAKHPDWIDLRRHRVIDKMYPELRMY